MRNLALYRLCGTGRATVKPSNQFVPVTRPLSPTGEREPLTFHYSYKAAMRQLGRHSGRLMVTTAGKREGILKPCGELNAKIPPNEAARPFRTNGPDGRGDRGRSPRFT
jgi:hypothetical protein